jgi:hypothetical protein
MKYADKTSISMKKTITHQTRNAVPNLSWKALMLTSVSASSTAKAETACKKTLQCHSTLTRSEVTYLVTE